MIVWNQNKLIQRLRAGPLPERESVGYLILWLAMDLLGKLPLKKSGNSYFQDTWSSFSVMVSFTVLTLLLCYFANKKTGEGRFIERYFALGFLALLRAIIAWILFLLAYFGALFILVKRQFPIAPKISLKGQTTLIADLLTNVLSVANIGFIMGSVLYYGLFMLLIVSYFRKLSVPAGGKQ